MNTNTLVRLLAPLVLASNLLPAAPLGTAAV
jgi:hypothetical protein